MTKARRKRNRNDAPADVTAAAPPAPATPPQRGPLVPERVWNVLTVLVVALILMGGTWRNYWQDGNTEQYRLLLLGRTLYQGGALYTQAPYEGLPGPAWAGAAAYVLGSGTPIVAWIGTGLIAAIAVVLAAAAAGVMLNSRAGRRTAILGAVVFCVGIYHGTAIDPYFFTAAALCAAMSLMLLSWVAECRASRVWFGIAAGLCWALAASMTHLGIVGLIVMGAGCLIAALLDRDERTARLAAVGYTATGFLVGLAIIIVLLAAGGSAGIAWHHFVALWGEQLATMDFDQGFDHAITAMKPVALYAWFAALGIVAMLLRVQARLLGASLIATLLVWWLVMIALLAAEPVVVLPHWLVAFPPMLLIAAAGVYRVGEPLKRQELKHRLPLFCAMITIVLLLGHPLIVQCRIGLRAARAAHTNLDGERNRLTVMATNIQSAVPRFRRIYVLADDPGVYVHADRPPACPITTPKNEADVDTVLEKLDAKLAFALIVPDTGPALGSACGEACTSRLQNLLHTYTRTAGTRDYDVYIRPTQRNTAELSSQ